MAKLAKSKSEKTEVSASYERTTEERAMLERLHNRTKGKPPARVKVLPGNEVRFDHEHDAYTGQVALMQALGVTSGDFLAGLLNQVANINGRSKANEEETNFALSIVASLEPRDQLETMLGLQMAAVHMATMTFARRLAKVENIQQQDSAEKAFNKLTRTFAMQMETLKRYRSGGEQRITVQHVTVNDGGQAVVGNVNTRTKAGEAEGGGDGEN